ncbi:X-ray repair cross-complementing protein 5 [Culicoides brevitarsis]|uniref:X-ray repair cross-complementing protein 5 n=1 Tax=Culicoides brevitarsis TaxID=469753 RepID=UPI00307CA00D
MPPKALKDAFVIVLDCSADSQKSSSKEGETFFERAKNCVLRIFERKIFAYSEDQLCLFLMGAPGNYYTENGEKRYKNITKEVDLQKATWDHCRFIDHSVKPYDGKADWFEALDCALDMLHDASDSRPFSKMKILLLSTLGTQTTATSKDVKEFINKTKVEDKPPVEIIVINDNIELTEEDTWTFSQVDAKTQEQETSENLIKQIISETDGVLCNLENAELELLHYEKQKTKGAPKYFTFKIGESISMEVVEYVKVAESKLLKSWQKMTSGGEDVKTERKYFLNDEEVKVVPSTVDPNEISTTNSSISATNSSMMTEITSPKSNISMEVDQKPELEAIRGYMFGPDAIASPGLFLDFGEKSLLCIGFSDAKYVRSEYLSGKGCHVVLPKPGFKSSIKKFASLVKALYETNYVIIARKVYQKRAEPKIVALFPEYNENERPFLTEIGLHYREYCIDIKFPSLRNARKFQPTQEQFDIMDQLIDSMDLMTVGNEKSGNAEAFSQNKTLNIAHQHMCRVIAHRALHPNAPIIDKISEELTALIDVPEKIRENSRDILLKAKELFVLEENKVPTKLQLLEQRLKEIAEKEAGNAENDQTSAEIDAKITRVGTVTPAEDFLFLVNAGSAIAEITQQLQNVIRKITFQEFTISKVKITKALVAYRSQAMETNPASYNDWIVRYKEELLSNEKQELFTEIVVNENLGLISSEESKFAEVTTEMAENFYTVAEKKQNTTIVAPQEDDNDLDDLIE